MMQNFHPAIVVVAFDRINSLNRILTSLSQGIYPENTKLIISIDNNGKNQNVVEAAKKFGWMFGEKEVIYQQKRLGLRNHIIRCGDLTYKYDSVIILEDDLYVSPFFYNYAQQALSYYKDDEKIAGISLYNLSYTESSKLPFIPIKDDSDVYFKQIPSSLGQAWTSKQWDEFKQWYDLNEDICEIQGLPYVVRKRWPESSWKKYFYAFLVVFDKFFIFPQNSFTTNFNDAGTNMITNSYFGQTQVEIVNKSYKFKKIKEAINVYDAYSEILPKKLNTLCNTLKGYNYEVDLYGRKEFFNEDIVLTTKLCKKSILSFKRSMKPHELNIVFNLEGEEIFLSRKEDVLYYPKSVNNIKYNRTIKDFINEYNYFYRNVFETNILFKIIKFRLWNKILKLLNLK